MNPTENYILDPENTDLSEEIFNNLNVYMNRKGNSPALIKIRTILCLELNEFLKYLNHFDKINVLNLTLIASYNYKNNVNISFRLNNCRVSESPIHGLGVFATREIKRKEIITLYPANIRNNIPIEFRDYIYNYKNISIAGNPKIYDDTTYLGHMINDASNSPIQEQYGAEVIKSSNSVFHNVLYSNGKLAYVVVVASKNITIGQEILTPYGCQYWSRR